MYDTRPRTREELDRRIDKEFGPGDNDAYDNTTSIMASAIIARLLPSGAVKGGSALRLRYGGSKTRFTGDVDIARNRPEDEFIDELRASLLRGWEGFTGALDPRPYRLPEEVQRRYAMVPYLIQLSYLRSPWLDVRLEVSHNELGDADEPDLVTSSEVSELFERIGLPSPGELPLMRLEYQIAQKLHAVSEPDSTRVHDFVDLQVMLDNSKVDAASLGILCTRLFAYRKAQKWPPYFSKAKTWVNSYSNFAKGLDVLTTVEEATEWTNDLVMKIDEATYNAMA